MDKQIILSFDKATSRLAGNPYGKAVYKEQLADNLDFNKMNIVIFPDSIERVASSFTQGMFEEIVQKLGYDGIENHIKIKAKNSELEKSIYEDLFY